jgi:ribosome-binding factor A
MGNSDRRRGSRRSPAVSDGSYESPDSLGHRHERLQRLIFEEVSSLLRDDVRDPALADVLLVGAELSLDYALVRLSYTSPAAQRLATGRALERVTGFLRGRLGDALDLKRIPQLRFIRDERVLDLQEDS